MEPFFAMNGLYFCFMLDGCLYFSISAYAALNYKMNISREPLMQRKLH